MNPGASGAPKPMDAESIRRRALFELEQMLARGVFDGPKLVAILKGRT